MRGIELADGTIVPAIGQGTWHMGERASERRREVAALQLGVDQGMTLIDTAEMYAEGGAEEVVGEALRGRRDQVFLVSKVYPHNASRRGIPDACARSLQRLQTDCIDLYLLHWRGRYPLEETVEAFERLKDEGKIRRWGVSNFDVADLEELPSLDGCVTDQVLYNPAERGVEFDLLPWCQARRMPVMAYCPIGEGGSLLRDPALLEVARRHNASAAQVALAWELRQPGVIVIPKAADPDHVRANAAAGELRLSEDDLAVIEAAFPAPQRKQPLNMV